MRSSGSERKKLFMLSPSGRVSERTSFVIQTDRLSLPNKHCQIVTSDPFREIQKGLPNSRLKPIILKKRSTNYPNLSFTPSLIRIPDLCDESKIKIKVNRQNLPRIYFPGDESKEIQESSSKIVKTNSERTFRKFSMKESESFTRKVKNKKNLNILEMSFGAQNADQCFPKNLLR